MKKLKIALAFAVLGSMSASCGFDDPAVEYPTKSVLFTYQQYNRELVIGEGLKFKLGVVFAGQEKSDRNRVVRYVIDETLVPKGKTLMPEDYYTLSDPSEIIVRKGTLKGYLPVYMDSLKFVSDPKSATGEYVIPFRIVEADADVITEGKEYMVLSLKYLAKQFGYYRYEGTRTNLATGDKENYTFASSDKTSARQLVTAGPARLRMIADPYGSQDPAKAAKYSFILNVPTYNGGEITLEADPASAVSVTQNGRCTYDAKNKVFNLNYKYSVGGVDYEAVEVLTFRNRIRDDQGNGVKIDEWQGF